MTRKHYKAIAEVIDGATLVNKPNRLKKKALIEGLCSVFYSDNNRFQRGLFEHACKESVN